MGWRRSNGSFGLMLSIFPNGCGAGHDRPASILSPGKPEGRRSRVRHSAGLHGLRAYVCLVLLHDLGRHPALVLDVAAVSPDPFADLGRVDCGVLAISGRPRPAGPRRPDDRPVEARDSSTSGLCAPARKAQLHIRASSRTTIRPVAGLSTLTLPARPAEGPQIAAVYGEADRMLGEVVSVIAEPRADARQR